MIWNFLTERRRDIWQTYSRRSGAQIWIKARLIKDQHKQVLHRYLFSMSWLGYTFCHRAIRQSLILRLDVNVSTILNIWVLSKLLTIAFNYTKRPEIILRSPANNPGWESGGENHWPLTINDGRKAESCTIIADSIKSVHSLICSSSFDAKILRNWNSGCFTFLFCK